MGIRAMLGWVKRNAVALTALVLALGGTSYAVTSSGSSSKDTVKACVSRATGAVRIAGGHARCHRSERSLALSRLNTAAVTALFNSLAPNARVAFAQQADSATSAGGAPPTGAATGALAGTYPGPTIAAAAAPTTVADNPNSGTDPCTAATPQTGIFCGTSALHWVSGTYAANALQFWKDRLGEVHIRGEAGVSAGSINGSAPEIFVLPPGFRPAALNAYPIAVGDRAGAFGGTEALLLIYPSGDVSVTVSGVSFPEAFFGEIEFRTDA